MFDDVIKHLQYFQYVSHCHGTVERCATCQYKGNICGRAEYTEQEILGLAADSITALQSENAEKDKEMERLRIQCPVQVDGDVMALTLELTETKAALSRLTAELDRAIADIPHKCWSCANGFYTEDGFDCDKTHYRGTNPDCLNWKWRGEKGDG